MPSSQPVTPNLCCLRGFTLTEMLVTLAVLCILIALAAPSFWRLIIDTRMTTEANQFLTTLHLTRSEAIKRNRRVTLCKSSDGRLCTTAGNWEQGWIVFVDDAAIGLREPKDELLRVHGPLSRGSALTGNYHIVHYISYLPNGQTRTATGAMQGGKLTLCSGLSATKGRQIVIATGSGRPRIDTVHPDC